MNLKSEAMESDLHGSIYVYAQPMIDNVTL